MANYFKWIYDTVYTQSGNDDVSATKQILGTFSILQPMPWYVVPPPSNLLSTPKYDPLSFPVSDISTIIMEDLKRDLHFSMKMDNTGDEGLYGLLHYCQLPDVELGLDIDIASFIAGATTCTFLGLYLDDVYEPRKLMAWWPTRWFFHFIEEGIYLGRSLNWVANATIIVTKTFFRAMYGGMTHTMSRILYYWLRKLLTGSVVYTPLVDDTFSALLSGYLWTTFTLESEQYSAYDKIICVGWCAVFTGLLEFCLFQYFLEKPPPGLFRWLFGGAFYGPGVWRYLQMGT